MFLNFLGVLQIPLFLILLLMITFLRIDSVVPIFSPHCSRNGFIAER